MESHLLFQLSDLIVAAYEAILKKSSDTVSLHHLVGSFQRVHQFPEADERPLVDPLHVNPKMLPVARVAKDLLKLEDLTEKKTARFFKTNWSSRTFHCPPVKRRAVPPHPLTLKLVAVVTPSFLAVIVVWSSQQTDALLALLLGNGELIDVAFNVSGPEQVCLHGCRLLTFPL